MCLPATARGVTGFHYLFGIMSSKQEYSAGDRVYYLYTNAGGTQVKFAAVVIAIEPDAVVIRVGRYDPGTQEIKTFESSVSTGSLEPRSVPCSYEATLEGSKA